jgi:hypothetical protein
MYYSSPRLFTLGGVYQTIGIASFVVINQFLSGEVLPLFSLSKQAPGLSGAVSGLLTAQRCHCAVM